MEGNSRNIRIFISSTFQDMQDERAELVTKVFPELRKIAAARDVTMTEIDLRWGISKEESESGKVIQICMNEIENSRPYFIGIIGDRYGWCPNLNEVSNNVLLSERYPWMKEDASNELSITEMEMQYGVLRNPEHINAFFYIKKNSDETNPKLHNLKNAVRNNKRYPWSEYVNPEDLGKQVKQCLIDLLDSQFPEEKLPIIEKERLIQQSFLHSRTNVYIPNQKYYDEIEQFLQSDKQHLVIASKSGMGKSSLIANWVKDCSEQSNYHTIYHFSGISSLNENNKYVLSRFANEIEEFYSLKIDNKISAVENLKEEAPEERFSRIINEINKNSRLLLIIDGINSLVSDGEEDVATLSWLPHLPSNVKIIFTSVDNGEVMKTFRRREYPIMQIEPLSYAQREKLVIDQLARYRKKLSKEQVKIIAEAELCGTPIVLRTILDELIQFGSFEGLNNRIHYYIDSNTPQECFSKVLERAEEEFGINLVRDVCCSLLCSKNGLSEDELIQMHELTQLQWSQFYSAFYNHFTQVGEHIFFSHRYLAEAIISRYFDNFEVYYRNLLIDYFSLSGRYANIADQDMIATKGDAYENICYQFWIGKQYESLKDYLLDSADLFVYFATNNYHDLEIYWRDIIKNNENKRLLSSYLDIDISETDKEFQWVFYLKLGFFSSDRIIDSETCAAAMGMATHILDSIPGDDERCLSLFARLFQVNAYIKLEQYDKADEIMDYLLSVIPPLYNESPEQFVGLIMRVYHCKGNLCLMQRDFIGALDYSSQAIAIYEKNKEAEIVEFYVQLISLKAEALYFIGNLSDSIIECEKAITISRSIARQNSNYVSLLADALFKGFRTFSTAGEIDKAKQLLNEFNMWYEDMGDDKPEHFEGSYINLLVSYSIWALYIDGEEEALRLAKKAIEIQKNSFLTKPDHDSTYLMALNNYASILLRVGNLQQSLDVVNEGIGIVENKMDSYPGVFDDLECLLKQTKGDILVQMQKYDDAIELLEPVVRKLRDICQKKGGIILIKLVWNINTLSVAFLQRERYEDSLILLDEAIDLLKGNESLPDCEEIYSNLFSNKGNVLFCLRQYEKAFIAIQNSITIADKKYEKQSKTFFNYASIINRNSLIIYNIAFALFSNGQYEEAEQYIIDAIELFQKLTEMNAIENVEMYAKALNLLGCIYQMQGKGEECIDIFEKAVELDSPEANFNLGNIYSANLENEDAQALAASYYMKAIELGYVNAHYYLSELCFKLSPDEELYKEIINHLEIFLESCTDDNLRMKSVYMLACSYVSLEETEFDEETSNKVFSYLEESANYGYIDIIPYYCSYLEEGIGTSVNKEEAFRWAIKGAQEDDILSQLILAEYYKEGTGTEKNKTESKKWLQKVISNEAVDEETKNEARKMLEEVQ